MIIFTEHALAKLAQRKISKDLVIETIENPNFKSKSHSNRIIFYKKFGKLHLSVVTKEENQNVIVITAHWVAKIRKL